MKNRWTAVIAASLLAACAGVPSTSDLKGRSEAEVLQAMGQPTGRYDLPDNGRRLEYAKGPGGRHTYMVDLDARGRVVQVEQVLDRRYFEAVSPGMKKDVLLTFIGRPSDVNGVRGGGQIWSWRYANNDCLWWQAQLDPQGTVVNAGYASLPGCDPQ
jgi:hypothetical protein